MKSIPRRRRRSARSALFAGLALLGVPFAANAQIESSPSSTYVAAVHANFPPQYLTTASGAPDGFAIDVMDRVAEIAGIRVRYMAFDEWAPAQDAIRQGRADIIPNIGITPDRQADYDFTSPYETFRISLFIRKDTTTIDDWADLQGQEVAVVRSNAALNLLAARGGMLLKVVPTVEEALFQLLSGQVDSLVYPEPVLIRLARQIGVEKNIRVVAKPLAEIKRGIAVRKGNPELVKKLDSALMTLLSSGDFREIHHKWYGKPTPFWTISRVAWTMSGVVFMVAFALIAWRFFTVVHLNRQLEANVENRRKAEESLREVVESAPNAFVIANSECKMLMVNSQTERIFGYSRDELITRHIDALFPERFRERFRELRTGCIANLAPCQVEESADWKAVRKGGSEFDVELKLTPIQTPSEQRLLLSIFDITERKTLVKQLHESQRIEAVGRLAGGIAHDFNNLLSVIIGNAQFALDAFPEGDPTRRDIQEILTAAERSASLTRQLLAFSRRHAMSLKSVHVNQVIEDMEDMLRRLIGEHIELETRLQANSDLVEADENLLSQVVMNLALNARDAMPVGGLLSIETGRASIPETGLPERAELKTGDYVRMSVIDTGTGMDEATRARIFEPFFTTKPLGAGTGLGLSIVFGIVKQFNGAVLVRSTQGKGTILDVYLPCQMPRHGQAEPVNVLDPSTLAADPTEAILLVEDEADVRRTVRRILEDAGYRVEEAARADEAIAKSDAQPGSFNLLLSDVVMPHMSGFEMARHVLRGQPHAKVIFITGYYDRSIAPEIGVEYGAHVIMKPVRQADLLMQVRNVLAGA